MAGLYDGIDPQTALLLGLGSGLLGTVGQGRRASFGEALANGMQAGTAGYRQAVGDRQRAEQMRAEQQMREQQMTLAKEQMQNVRDDRLIRAAEMQRQEEERRRKRAFYDRQASGGFTVSPEQQAMQQFGGPTNAAAMAAPAMSPQVDRDAELRAAVESGVLPYDKYLEMTAKQGPQFDKIDPSKFTPQSIARFAKSQNYAELVPRDKLENWNGNAVNPYNVQPGAVDQYDPNKPFGLRGGQPVANVGFQDYEKQKAQLGATRVSVPVSVNTAKNFWESAADVVGKSLGTSYDLAKGAQSTVQTAEKLLGVLDSGKVLAGPGTSPVRIASQVGSMLGIGGKDFAEVAKNTTRAIQEMAQLELDSAQQMKGQGAMTEAERAIARKAAAGDIGDSVPEIRARVQALAAVGRRRLAEHQQTVNRVRQNRDSGPLADFMAVDAPPAYSPPAGPRATPATPLLPPGWKITEVPN
jgi:hypothetical protein